MKKILIILLAVLILFGLCGCGKNNTTNKKTEHIQIYYAYKDQHQNSGELIGPLDVPVSEGADLLYSALTKIMEEPQSDKMVTVFPENVKILSYLQEGEAISVSLTPAYNTMNPAEKSIAKACLVLTLCQLEEIASVSIYVEDRLVDSELTAEDIILPNYERSDYEKQLTLYFADNSDSFLEKEKHILTIGQDRNPVEYVIEELARGPQNEYLNKTLPKDTDVLSVAVKKNLCIVDLSKEFWTNRPGTAAGERMAIYSIVNSMTEIIGIDAVQILVEGEKIDKYYTISLNEPLTKDNDIVWHETTEINKSVINIYMGMEDGRMVSIPYKINMNYSVSLEQNVVETMLSLKSRFGYFPLIPAGTELYSIYTEERICHIDLSREFYVEGANLRIDMAMKALAAAIIDTGNADYVTISVEGKVIGSKIGKDESIIIY